MISFADMTLDMLIAKGGYDCACGRHHGVDMDYLSIKSGAVREIPQALSAMGKKKPFIICDRNTKAAAWARIEPVLNAAKIPAMFAEIFSGAFDFRAIFGGKNVSEGYRRESERRQQRKEQRLSAYRLSFLLLFHGLPDPIHLPSGKRSVLPVKHLSPLHLRKAFLL